ncbi:MAG: DNA repair protein RadC [Oscillospiraceae bacterium]|nr:DNA repair protein RadC [Oscillospiraceae bacterium]
MGIHDGHRERMREKVEKIGLDSLQEHEVLEVLLYLTNPRKDTNPLAHELIGRFHSLAGVLEAPAKELKEVAGVGEQTAYVLRLIPQLARRYMKSRAETKEGDILDSSVRVTEKARKLIESEFYGSREEAVYAFAVNNRLKLIGTVKLSEGTAASAGVPLSKLVEFALSHSATGVILAHNHPSGRLRPSRADIETTEQIRELLQKVGVKLLDHVIVGNDDSFSFADAGLMDRE